MTPRRSVAALGVAIAIAGCAWGLRRHFRELQRQATLLSHRDAIVSSEIARVQARFHQAPPRTIADVTAIVGSASYTCHDTNESGPLDDPRDDPCPRGSACHQAFFVATWFVRRHIELQEARVWYDRKLDADASTMGRLRVHVAGCEPESLVVAIEPIELARFLLRDW